MRQSRGMNPESQYHQLVEATSVEEILNVVSRMDGARLGIYTLAVRKIARGVKEKTNKALFSDERYKKLKAKVLEGVQELNEQEMCDVLYWLRVLYEAYSNLEWLGQVTLHRLETRLTELVLQDRFKHSQIINVFLDAAMLRLDTTEVEEVVCKAMEEETFRLNLAEVHMLLSGFYLVFDKERERMLGGYYAMMSRQSVLSSTETVMLLMTLQTLCEAEAEEELADIRPFQRLILEEVKNKVSRLCEEHIERLLRLIGHYPDLVSLCPELIPEIEKLLENTATTPQVFVSATEWLGKLHTSGTWRWDSGKERAMWWLQRWTVEGVLTDNLFGHLLSLLATLEASVDTAEVAQITAQWKNFPLSLDPTLCLLSIACRCSNPPEDLLTFAVTELIDRNKLTSAREICRTIDHLRTVKHTNYALKGLENKCWSLANTLVRRGGIDSRTLYYPLQYKVMLRSILEAGGRVAASSLFPLMLKYAVLCYPVFPTASRLLFQVLVQKVGSYNLEEALMPSTFPYDFGTVIQLLLQFATTKMTPEGVLRLSKYATGTVTREECQSYLQLIEAVPGDYYGSQQLSIVWPTVTSLFVKAEVTLPGQFLEGLCTGALDDFRNGGKWEISKAASVMSYLVQSEGLTKKEGREVLQSVHGLGAALKHPFSLNDATSALSSLVSQPSPASLASFLSTVSSSLPHLTVDDQLTILERVHSEPSAYPDPVLDPLSSLIEAHWSAHSVLLSNKQLVQVLMLSSRSQRYHRGLARLATSRIRGRLGNFSAKDKAKLLCALSIPDEEVTQLMEAAVRSIMMNRTDTLTLGSQLLEAFHDSNRLTEPLYRSFASYYIRELGRQSTAEHFDFVQSVPYLIRTDQVTPAVVQLSQQSFQRDFTCVRFPRKLALSTYFRSTGVSQFAFDYTAIASGMRHNTVFAHPLLTEVSQALGDEVELFPQSAPVAVPLYVKATKTGVWLHPRSLLSPTGTTLRGDFEWYSSLAAKQFPRFVAVPTPYSGSLAAVLRLLKA